MAVFRMGPHWTMLAAGAAGAGLGGAAATFAGAAYPFAALASVLGLASAASLAAAASALRGRAAAEARFDTLAQEMILIRQRQIETETRLETVERQAQDSPALVWRAATSDIQVLGALVSDLAKSVAVHEDRLAGIGATMPSAAVNADPASDAAFMLPQTSPAPPSWFEEEAELGFTAEAAPVQPQGAAPAPTPAAVMAELRSTLASALASDRLEICLQPYVSLPQRRVAGYEATLALKAGDGVARDAESLRVAARASGMAAELDRLLVERAGQVMRVLRARERSVAMTCAVSGTSFLDAGFRSAVEAVARAEGKSAQNLMLSIPMEDAPRLLREGKAALESLGRSGVSLGARGLSASGIDAAALEKLAAREFRLPASALTGSDGAAQPDIHPGDVGELLERRGVRLVISGIEDEATMRDLLDCAAAFGQGALFGASRPVRPEVLQPRSVAEAGAARVEASRAPAEPRNPRRQSFRSLLRRA